MIRVASSVWTLVFLGGANAHRLIAIQRRQVPVVEAVDDLWPSVSCFHMLGHELHHEGQGEWTVNQKIAMPLDTAGVVTIKMDAVSIKGEGRKAKEKLGGGREHV